MFIFAKQTKGDRNNICLILYLYSPPTLKKVSKYNGITRYLPLQNRQEKKSIEHINMFIFMMYDNMFNFDLMKLGLFTRK